MAFSRILPIILVFIFVCCAIAQATITVEYNQNIAWADDTLGANKTSSDSSRAIPTDPDPLHVDAIDGEAYSKNVFDWSIVGGQTVLSFDSNLKRVGNRGAMASLAMGDLAFIANETTSYELSGYLNVTDIDEGKSGIVNLYARLDDVDLGRELFRGEQSSMETHDAQLSLGGSGGDQVSVNDGSLTGTLIAGRRYSLEFAAIIRTDSEFYPGDADSGATAVGNFTLKIGTVPEPNSAALCSLLAPLGLIRRNRFTATLNSRADQQTICRRH